MIFSRAAFGQENIAVDIIPHFLDKRISIQKIIIIGNKKTRDKIILRELNIKTNQALSTDSLPALIEQNKLRLATLGLFTEIKISIDTLNSSEITWNINVKERWFIIPEPVFQLADRNFNVWWVEQNKDIRRTIIGLTLRDKNFRGNLENLSITAQVGYTQKLIIDYFKPYLDKHQKHGAGISFGFAESQETFYSTDSNKLKFIKTKDNYIMRQYEGAVTYAYRPAYASKHFVKLGYKHYEIEDTIAKLNPEYFENGSKQLSLLEFTYRFEMNKTDNWNYPLKGTKIIAQFIARTGIDAMSSQVLGTLEVGKYYNPWNKWYISSTFRGRLTGPEDQPYVFQSALGSKFDYVRGYEYYVIDGSHFGLVRFNLKRELLDVIVRNIRVKYLPVIPIKIYPKIFADAGYVRNQYAGNSFLNNRMLYAAGVGVDIFTAYDIKIRLEYAWNHLGQKGLFLHFNSE